MKKLSKAILIGLAVPVALGITLVVSLNLYIQSPGSQARLQEELSKLLRLPLKITNVSVSPFGDLRITGISISNGGANFLEATSFKARYRWFPLLHGTLVIPEMSVLNPKIVWVQSADGKWKLPEPEQAANTAAREGKAAPAKNDGARQAEGGGEKAAGEKKGGFSVLVERFNIKGGAVELLDRASKHVAVFSDVNMTCTSLTPELIEGAATIGKLVWNDSVTVEKVSARFKYADGILNVPEITAAISGGTLQGRYYSFAEKGHAPYKLAVTLTKVDLDQLATQLGSPAGQMTGSLTGQLEFHGDTTQTERLDGGATHFELRNAQFHQLDLLQNIGLILGMRELSDLRVRDGRGELRLAGNKILVDKFVLNTTDLQLSALGSARLDKRLNLRAQLSAGDAVVDRLPSIIRDGFGPSDGGRRSVDFAITGNADKPKTDLLDKFTGRKINAQFGDVLGAIFGAVKKSGDDRGNTGQTKPEKEHQKEDKAAGPDTAPPAPVTPPSDPAAANQ